MDSDGDPGVRDGAAPARRSGAVVLLGAPGCGKTTLAAALLGTDPASPGPGRLGAGALPDDPGVWLLDPPGSPELAGELHVALRAADAVLLVVSPVQGVDPRSVALWESLEHLPRLVVLSQLDRPGADADEAVAVCQRLLGEGVLPLQLPLHEDDGAVGGTLDLLHLRVTEGESRRAADPEHATLVADLRAELVEAVLTGSDDDEVFERFLQDEEPPPDVLDRELARAVGHGDLHPVLVASPRRGVGLDGLAAVLAAVVGALPGGEGAPVPAVSSPAGAPLAAGLVAEVLRPGLVRVWHGAVEPGAGVVVGERATTWDGPAAAAGDLVAALPDARPRTPVGDVPLVLSPWDAPAPPFPVGAPEDAALAARVLADPSARLGADPRTGQLLLWTHGPAHAELLLAGLPSAPVRVPPGTRPVGVRVRVPAWAERAVRSDLTARGAEVAAGPTEGGDVLLDVRLPPAEAAGYALALGRVSAHTGTLERDGDDAPRA